MLNINLAEFTAVLFRVQPRLMIAGHLERFNLEFLRRHEQWLYLNLQESLAFENLKKKSAIFWKKLWNSKIFRLFLKVLKIASCGCTINLILFQEPEEEMVLKFVMAVISAKILRLNFSSYN